MPLKSRQLMIPGGFRFLQPETGWVPSRWSSFASIVDQVIAHRQGMPHLIAKNGWSVDRATVEAEVDNFNSKICQQMGWLDFIEGGGPVPLPFLPGQPQIHHHPLQGISAVGRGSVSLVEWIKDGAEAVPAELATQRAKVCALRENGQPCPLNQEGDWTRFFTVPVSNAIRMELQRRRDMALSTPYDDNLGVCAACDCPLPLMVHIPLEYKLKRLSPGARASLDPGCWVLAEAKAINA